MMQNKPKIYHQISKFGIKGSMNEIFHSIAVNVNDVLRDDVRYDVTKVARILSCKDNLLLICTK